MNFRCENFDFLRNMKIKIKFMQHFYLSHLLENNRYISFHFNTFHRSPFLEYFRISQVLSQYTHETRGKKKPFLERCKQFLLKDLEKRVKMSYLLKSLRDDTPFKRQVRFIKIGAEYKQHAIKMPYDFFNVDVANL